MSNEITQLYRKRFPTTPLSDEEITLKMADLMRQEGNDFTQFPEFASEVTRIERQRKNLFRPSVASEFSTGVNRGIESLKGTAFGGGALLADVAGFDETSDRLLGKAQEAQEAASRFAPTVQGVQSIESARDLLSFIAGGFGEVTPSIVESIGTGVAGAVAGSLPGAAAGFFGKSAAKKVIRNSVEELVQKKLLAKEVADQIADAAVRKSTAREITQETIEQLTARGVAREIAEDTVQAGIRAQVRNRTGMATILANSMFLNAGETFNELAKSDISRGEKITAALGAGSIAGALDAAMPIAVIRKFFPGIPKADAVKAVADTVHSTFRKGPFLRFLTELGKTSGVEGVTESLQEAIQETAVSLADPNHVMDTGELGIRMVNAAILGAFGGGLAGAPIGVYEALRTETDNLKTDSDGHVVPRGTKGEDFVLEGQPVPEGKKVVRRMETRDGNTYSLLVDEKQPTKKPKVEPDPVAEAAEEEASAAAAPIEEQIADAQAAQDESNKLPTEEEMQTQVEKEVATAEEPKPDPQGLVFLEGKGTLNDRLISIGKAIDGLRNVGALETVIETTEDTEFTMDDIVRRQLQQLQEGRPRKYRYERFEETINALTENFKAEEEARLAGLAETGVEGIEGIEVEPSGRPTIEIPATFEGHIAPKSAFTPVTKGVVPRVKLANLATRGSRFTENRTFTTSAVVLDEGDGNLSVRGIYDSGEDFLIHGGKPFTPPVGQTHASTYKELSAIFGFHEKSFPRLVKRGAPKKGKEGHDIAKWQAWLDKNQLRSRSGASFATVQDKVVGFINGLKRSNKISFDVTEAEFQNLSRDITRPPITTEQDADVALTNTGAGVTQILREERDTDVTEEQSEEGGGERRDPATVQDIITSREDAPIDDEEDLVSIVEDDIESLFEVAEEIGMPRDEVEDVITASPGDDPSFFFKIINNELEAGTLPGLQRNLDFQAQQAREVSEVSEEVTETQIEEDQRFSLARLSRITRKIKRIRDGTIEPQTAEERELQEARRRAKQEAEAERIEAARTETESDVGVIPTATPEAIALRDKHQAPPARVTPPKQRPGKPVLTKEGEKAVVKKHIHSATDGPQEETGYVVTTKDGTDHNVTESEVKADPVPNDPATVKVIEVLPDGFTARYSPTFKRVTITNKARQDGFMTRGQAGKLADQLAEFGTTELIQPLPDTDPGSFTLHLTPGDKTETGVVSQTEAAAADLLPTMGDRLKGPQEVEPSLDADGELDVVEDLEEDHEFQKSPNFDNGRVLVFNEDEVYEATTPVEDRQNFSRVTTHPSDDIEESLGHIRDSEYSQAAAIVDTLTQHYEGIPAQHVEFLKRLFDRLQSVNPFAMMSMELAILEDSEFNGIIGSDAQAAFSEVVNTMYLRKSATPRSVLTSVTHELGHFVGDYVIDPAELQDLWESLPPEKRLASYIDYYGDLPKSARSSFPHAVGGLAPKTLRGIIADVPGLNEELIRDRAARAEWIAMQWGRVVHAGVKRQGEMAQAMRLEGMTDQIITALFDFYKFIRETISIHILGSQTASDKSLDAALEYILGETSSKEEAIPMIVADKLKPYSVEIATLRVMTEKNSLSIKELGDLADSLQIPTNIRDEIVESLSPLAKDYTLAVGDYELLRRNYQKALTSLAEDKSHYQHMPPEKAEAAKKVDKAIDTAKGTSSLDIRRRQRLQPILTGQPSPEIIAQRSWALNDAKDRLYGTIQAGMPIEVSRDDFIREFTSAKLDPDKGGKQKIEANEDLVFDKVPISELDEAGRSTVSRDFAVEASRDRDINQRAMDRDNDRKSAAKKALKAEREKLSTLEKSLADATKVVVHILDAVKANIGEFKDTLKAQKHGYRKIGALGQEILALEGSVSSPVIQQYSDAYDNIISQATKEPLKLFDLIDEVVNAEIEVKGRPIRDVQRDFIHSGNARLANIARDRLPLFTAIVNFIRTNQVLTERLILRKLPDLKERAALLQEDIAAIQGKAKEASKLARKNADKIVKASQLQGRLQETRRQAAEKIRVLEEQANGFETSRKARLHVIKHLEAAMNDALIPLHPSIRANLIQDTIILDPPKDDATPKQFGNKTKFSYDGDEIIPLPEWQAIMQRMWDWMNGPNGDKNRARDGFFYNAVEAQYRKMQRVMHERNASDSMVAHRLWFFPLAQRLKRTGTFEGRRLNSMLFRFQAFREAWFANAERHGRNAAVARQKAIEAMGMDKEGIDVHETFTNLFDTPLKNFLENPGATFEQAMDSMRADPSRARYMNNTTEGLLRKYVESEAKSSRFFAGLVREAGLQVTDDELHLIDPTTGKKTPIERNHLELGTHTFMVTPNMHVVGRVRKAMKGKWTGWKSSDKAKEAATNDNALRDIFLDEDGVIWRDFLKPLVFKEKAPVFYRAAGTDEIQAPITREEATTAFIAANGDAPKFFKSLYALSGETSVEYEAWLGDQLKTLRRYRSNLVRDYKASRKNRQYFPSNSNPHVSMDARRRDFYPPEWLRYRQASRSSNRFLANHIAFHGAFGKDGAEWKNTIQALGDFFTEQQSDFAKLETQVAEWKSRNPNATKKQVRAIRRQLSGGEVNLRKLRLAGKNRGEVSAIDAAFRGNFESDLGPSRDQRTGMELLSLLVKGILNGPRAALIQFNQLFFPFLLFGPSKTAFSAAGQQFKFTMQDFFGGFFQMFGKVIDEGNVDFQEQKALFGIDPDVDTPFFDSFFSDHGPDDSFQTTKQRARMYLRMLNGLASRGYSKADAERAIYNGFKPWAPFAQGINNLNTGAMIVTRRAFDKLASKAIQHIQSNPDLLEDTDFKFSPTDLGYRNNAVFNDRFAFDRMNSILQTELGITLEQVARRSVEKGQSPFSTAEKQIISSVGLQQLASEANFFTSRPAGLKDGVGRFMFPLLGWSIQQPNIFVGPFKNPKTEQINGASVATGMMGLAMYILPLSLSFSLFMDFFDEFLMGKKNSIRPLFRKEDWAASTIERTARNGLLGMPFELVNLALNVGQEGGDLRTFSLDRRVVFASAVRGLMQTMGTLGHVGPSNATYATVARPFFQAFGGNGILQHIDLFNGILDMFGEEDGIPMTRAESRVVQRINARNYLRTAGRSLGLETRNVGGVYSAPTPMTPHVTNMILSAYGQDERAFRSAWQKARRAAVEMGKEDPDEAVARSYQARHPLRTVFRRSLTESEFSSLLGRLNPRGRQDVQEAISQYNRFGATIGVNPFQGKEDEPIVPVQRPQRRRRISQSQAILPVGF